MSAAKPNGKDVFEPHFFEYNNHRTLGLFSTQSETAITQLGGGPPVPGGEYELAAGVFSVCPGSDRLMRLKSPAGRRVATTGRLRPRFHIRCRNTGALKSLPSREKKCSVHDTVQCRKPVGKVGGGGTHL